MRFAMMMTIGVLVGSAHAQPGWVLSHQKINDTDGGFTGILGHDLFGTSVASLGDLDGDGVGDLAVGAPLDHAVSILFLNTDGTVKSHHKISDIADGLSARYLHPETIGDR